MPPPVFLISGRDPLLTSGGSESYVIAHARSAILAGYEPHVFSIAARSEVLETEFGVLHRVYSPVRPPRSVTAAVQRPWFVPPVARAVERRVPASGPVVIHSFGAWSIIAAAAAERLRRRGFSVTALATVFTSIEHETEAKLGSMVVRESPMWHAFHRAELAWARRVTTPLDRRALRAMHTVVVNYDNLAAQLADLYGRELPLRRLTYTPATAFDGASERATPELLRGFGDPSAPLIVSLSRHDGRKGLDTLIGALSLLRDEGPPFRACLIGPGVLLEAHRKLVRRVGLEEHVLVPGRVADVMAYLRAADVYVLPSRQEGSGSVALLEALQAGVASVVTNVDGLPEDVTDGRDGLLVRPGDRRVLARAIRTLIEDPALRERLGTAGRATFARRFAPQVFARELRELYSELGLATSDVSLAERTALAT